MIDIAQFKSQLQLVKSRQWDGRLTLTKLVLKHLYSYKEIYIKGSKLRIPEFYLELLLGQLKNELAQLNQLLFQALHQKLSNFNQDLQRFSIKNQHFQGIQLVQSLALKYQNIDEVRDKILQLSAFGSKRFDIQMQDIQRQSLMSTVLPSKKIKEQFSKLGIRMAINYQLRKQKVLRSPFQNKYKTYLTAKNFILLVLKLNSTDSGNKLVQMLNIQQQLDFFKAVSGFWLYAYQNQSFQQANCLLSFMEEFAQNNRLQLTDMKPYPTYFFPKLPVFSSCSLPSYLFCQTCSMICESNLKVRAKKKQTVNFYFASQLAVSLLNYSFVQMNEYEALVRWAISIKQLYFQLPFWIKVSQTFIQQAEKQEQLVTERANLVQMINRFKSLQYKVSFGGVQKCFKYQTIAQFMDNFQNPSSFEVHYNNYVNKIEPADIHGKQFWTCLLKTSTPEEVQNRVLKLMERDQN